MFLFTKIFPLFVQISNWYGGDKETADYTSRREKNKWFARLTLFGGWRDPWRYYVEALSANFSADNYEKQTREYWDSFYF